MEDKQDIYASPGAAAGGQAGAEPPDPGGLPPVSRVWRNFVAGILLMVAVLTAVALVVHFDEESTRKPETDDEEPSSPFAKRSSPDKPAQERTDAMGERTPRNTIDPILTLPVSAEAEAAIRPAPSMDPARMGKAMRKLRMARDFLEEREFDSAEGHALEALEAWPDMNGALRMLGVIYWQRGQFNDAIAILERAREDNPFSAEICNNLAMSYLQLGDVRRAQELLETALDMNPDYYVTRLNLGFLHLARSRFDLAVEHIEAALQQNPNSASARNNLGVALIRLGRYDDARIHFQFVVERVPDVADSYFNLAVIDVLEEDFAAALEWIRRGADKCSAAELQRYLADPDLDDMRAYPAFEEFVNLHFSGRPVS